MANGQVYTINSPRGRLLDKMRRQKRIEQKQLLLFRG